MDLTNVTLVGLVAFGVVNVVSFYKPDMKPELKFGLSFIAALGVTFIPVDVANVIMTHIKEALAAALALSGVYKIATRVGGK